MNPIKLSTLAALFLNLSAYSQAPAPPSAANIETKSNWKSINESNYTIQHPDNWDVDRSGQMGTSFIILSRQTSLQDQFRENVNLLIQDLTGMNLDLNSYTQISEEQIETMIANGKLLESQRLNAHGKTFHKVIYTGEQGPYQLKFEQFYWVQNEKAYVLTFTAEVDQFDAYRETGEGIMNSFLLK